MDKESVIKNFEGLPRAVRFHVAPRYSGGSPAMVDYKTALHVALDELDFYEMSLEGTFGNDRLELAKKTGLAHIVYARREKGKKVHRHDLLTGEEFIEPPRLEHDEIERVKTLLRWIEINDCISPALAAELAGLMRRAVIHRQMSRLG